MDFTPEKYIRRAVSLITAILVTAYAGLLFNHFGFLDIGSGVKYTTAQLVVIAGVVVIPELMLIACRRGYDLLAGLVIQALVLAVPFLLVDEAFLHSLPQIVWLPYVLAIAICGTRWAILTFVTTVAVIFMFFPIADTRTPIATAAIAAIIFVVSMFSKIMQDKLIAKALAVEKAAKDSETALRKSEERYRAVFQHTIDAISVSRISDGTYLEANDAFFQLTGFSPDEIIGVREGVKIVWADMTKFDEMQRHLAVHPAITNFEACFKRKEGGHFWGLLSSRTTEIDGVLCRIAVTRDITEHREAEELIHSLAYFDQLTQLPNRIQLVNRLRQTMDVQVSSGSFGALLLIDLDDFKTLNDSRGHGAGDMLLKQIAERLVCCIQTSDTVARSGGDEFIVMLAEIGHSQEEAMEQAKHMAETVLAVLNQEFRLEQIIHRNTVSIGVCLFSGREIGTEPLMKRLELAMYRAKHEGKNRIRFFDPSMEAAIVQRAALEIDLRNALPENQFFLHYQAQIADAQLVGAEVLVRWRHPTRGIVSPAEFIPLAEETGLVVPLGQWVLENACHQLARWNRNPRLEHLTIAVNVSIQQFNQANFVDQVLAILSKTGADPTRLKLELTESLLASDVNAIIVKMNVLKAEGIRFSLDDFGTGYSSLSYLKRLPIDQLKIDQSFVRDLLDHPADIAIARTIIRLGQDLGLAVIAEGVETAQHQAFLSELGCKAYQGYLYGRPMSIEDFELQPGFIDQGAISPSKS